MAKACARPGNVARTSDRWRITAPATLFVHGVAKGLAGREDGRPAGGDGDGFAGLWISAASRCAVPGGELSEPRDRHRLAPGNGVGDGRENGVERGVGVGLRQRGRGGDLRTELRSVHSFFPFVFGGRCSAKGDALSRAIGTRNRRGSTREGAGGRCGACGRGCAALLGHLACATICALAAAPAAAMQILEAADHGELRAQISARAVSRVALGNDRIARVVRAPGGFEVEHDPARGDLYLRPLSDGAGAVEGVPVTLFVGTEKGFTYRLTLEVADRGSAQILIRNADATATAGAGEALAGDQRIATLTALVRAVARREPLPGYRIAAAPAAGAPGPFTVVETWRGPRFEALVLELGPDGPGDAAALGLRLGPGVAALWLAAPGTAPGGGRLAVAVRAVTPGTEASR